MAAEAEASREARAKVIAADGEMRASKALREASNIIDESPSALQLRYLQVMLYYCFVYFRFTKSLSCTITNSIDSIFSDPKFNSSREKLYDYIPGTNRLRITIREQQK